MMDAAKAADLVLLMIDGSFGLEMETFEFLNLLQVRQLLIQGGVGDGKAEGGVGRG
jgi:hypothetical protein